MGYILKIKFEESGFDVNMEKYLFIPDRDVSPVVRQSYYEGYKKDTKKFLSKLRGIMRRESVRVLVVDIEQFDNVTYKFISGVRCIRRFSEGEVLKCEIGCGTYQTVAKELDDTETLKVIKDHLDGVVRHCQEQCFATVS